MAPLPLDGGATIAPMTTYRMPRASKLVPLAVTEDETAARRWVSSLDAAGIHAELRIEDTRGLGTGSSMLPLGPVFATALYVPAEQRTEAATVLIDLGWDGRHVSGGLRGRPALPLSTLVSALLAALAGGLAVAIAVVLRGG